MLVNDEKTRRVFAALGYHAPGFLPAYLVRDSLCITQISTSNETNFPHDVGTVIEEQHLTPLPDYPLRLTSWSACLRMMNREAQEF